jgi:hypothetical protein
MNAPPVPSTQPMIERESQPESLPPSPQLREALSWKLVSELHRRHPGDFTVIETHPGGGQYDCLSLWAGSQTVADLNRVGGFNVFSGGQGIPWQELWSAGLVEGGIADLLDRMSRECGLTIPAQLPPTGPETLVYRVMAGVSAALVFDKASWEWRNGQLDTSGCNDQGYRDQWFDAFPGAKAAARAGLPDAPFGNSKYGFWFLLKDDQPMVCLSKNSLCWDSAGEEFNLTALYRRERRIHGLVGVVLGMLR